MVDWNLPERAVSMIGRYLISNSNVLLLLVVCFLSRQRLLGIHASIAEAEYTSAPGNVLIAGFLKTELAVSVISAVASPSSG